MTFCFYWIITVFKQWCLSLWLRWSQFVAYQLTFKCCVQAACRQICFLCFRVTFVIAIHRAIGGVLLCYSPCHWWCVAMLFMLTRCGARRPATSCAGNRRYDRHGSQSRLLNARQSRLTWLFLCLQHGHVDCPYGGWLINRIVT